jgi:hypothetical protein
MRSPAEDEASFYADTTNLHTAIKVGNPGFPGVVALQVGRSHLQELGVTGLELLPVADTLSNGKGIMSRATTSPLTTISVAPPASGGPPPRPIW